MQFVEAFEKLGYKVEDPRQDWSAAKPDGICISLWTKERRVRDGLMWMNTRIHADPPENWASKPGNRKRIQHLERAQKEFNGKVDVVILSGTPGQGYGSAQPWIAEGARAGTYWQITEFDADDYGHFEVALKRI